MVYRLLNNVVRLFSDKTGQQKFVSFRVLFPNLVTILALCSGVSALQMALDGRFRAALFLVIFAAILDALDGRLARALKGCSRFGAELDSLADFVNFGVVPVLILYIWKLNEIGNFAWLAVLIYVVAMALRLARFNVSDILEDNTGEIAQPKPYFTGVPAPVGAIVVLQPLFLYLTGFTWIATAPLLVLSALYVIMIAGFLICRLQTVSLKRLRLQAVYFLPVFAGLAVFCGFLFSYPWGTFSVLNTLYVTYLIFLAIKKVTIKSSGDVLPMQEP